MAGSGCTRDKRRRILKQVGGRPGSFPQRPCTHCGRSLLAAHPGSALRAQDILEAVRGDSELHKALGTTTFFTGAKLSNVAATVRTPEVAAKKPTDAADEEDAQEEKGDAEEGEGEGEGEGE